MKAIIVGISVALMYGCYTEPKVQSTKQWEKHYYTVDQFKEGTSSIELDDDESIWVLSNHTLNRLLRDVK